MLNASRTSSWENLGHKTLTSDLHTALKDLDLDYTVRTTEAGGVADGSFIRLPNRLLTYRDDTNEAFGIVSERYQVIQNQEAFSFIENIDDLQLTHGGHTSWGSVWMIGKLPEVKILDDAVQPNLIFQTSHDGSVPMKATICMLRLACQNQFTHSFNDSPATVRIKHVGNVESKLEEAAQVLRSVDKYIRSYQAQAEFLATKKVTPEFFNKVLDKFFAIPEEASTRAINRAEEDRQDFLDAYHADDNGNFIGTRWGLINAYTDYFTHKEVRDPQNSFLWNINENSELGKLIEFVTPRTKTVA